MGRLQGEEIERLEGELDLAERVIESLRDALSGLVNARSEKDLRRMETEVRGSGDRAFREVGEKVISALRFEEKWRSERGEG